jgi:ketosteroid isomerase-like protein
MNKIGNRSLVLGFALSGLAACTSPSASVDTAKEAETIKAQEAAWSKELTAKDPDKFIAHYTDDAIVYVSGFPLARGKAAIRDAIGGAFKDPNFSLSFAPEKVVVGKGGDLAYSTGSYESSGTDPKTKVKTTSHGQYVTAWVRGADGRWLAQADFAGDLPTEAAAAASGPSPKKM